MDMTVKLAIERLRARTVPAGEFDADAAEAMTLLEELERGKAMENRANLVAGLAQHNPDLQGQFRAAVFILTGSWPD